MFKKITKIISIVFLIVIIGGISGVVFDRFVIPWMSSKEVFKGFSFFQKANERVTVINKTEQVTVKEDFSFAKTTQNVLPAVVSIITHGKTVPADRNSLINIQSSQDIQKNIKTGIILTSDGLIMSVWDQISAVPEKDSSYKVLAADGREFDAELLTVDPLMNLAFYKIKATNLPVPSFGNSDDLENGEKLIICGNAGGEYQNTFSAGIIKEKDKTFTLLNSELSSSEKMEGAVIADAVIDSKNIGGPVVDFNGTVVGVANQIEKDGKMVGFILPINSAKNSIDRMISVGNIERPRLGVYYLSINREIAFLNGLPVSKGALVYSFLGQQGLAVMKNSPADVSGIKIGDIILAVNGEEINLDQPLSKLIAKHAKGEEVTLKVLRGSSEMEVKTKLE